MRPPALAIAEMDPPRRRLVLRARFTALEGLKRGVVTIFALLAVASLAAPLLGASLLGHSSLVYYLIYDGELIFYIGAGGWILTRNWGRSQTAEIAACGEAKALRIRRRGCFGWFPRSEEVRAEPGAPPLHFIAGVTRGRPWLELWVERRGKAPRRLTPRFAVEGVERRDEVRELAALLSRCLGLRISRELDDVSEYRVALGRSGEPPPSPTYAFRGYRQPPAEVAPSFGRPPSVDEPKHPPPPLEPWQGQYTRIRRDERGFAVDRPKTTSGPVVIALFVAWVCIFSGVGAFRYHGGHSDWSSFLLLAAAPVVPVVPSIVKSRPTRPWRLAADRLEIRGKPAILPGEASLVRIRPLTHPRGYVSWLLFVQCGWRRYRLAEAAPEERPMLDSLALEVSRTLKAPLRVETRRGSRFPRNRSRAS